MARIFTETFDGPSASAGATLTTSNTTYNAFGSGGGSCTFVNSPSRSGLAAHIVGTSTLFRRMNQNLGVAGTGVPVHYRRAYFQVTSLAALTYLMLAALGSTATASLRVNTDGTLSIRNGNTAVATTILSKAVNINEWFRVEWMVNATTSTQTIQIFVGANVDGTTPDDTKSGTYTGGNFDVIGEGLMFAAAADVYVDNVAGDDSAFPGPEVTNVIGRPTTDITVTSWTGSSAVTPLSQLIGESTRDDSTYVISGNNPSSQVFETKLNTVTLPSARTGFTITYAVSAPSSTSATVLVSLYEGTTLRAGPFSHSVGTAIQQFTDTLTDAQCAAITAGTDLRLRFVVTAS